MILVSFLSFLSFLSFRGAADPTYLHCNCSYTNFTGNSIYQSNLNLLLSSLPSNASRNNGFLNGFYNTTAGEDPDKVYALFLCRGDVSWSTCQNCVTFAARNVTERCPDKKEAIIWFDPCLLRYSDEYFFSTMDTEPVFPLYNTLNGTESFDQPVYILMNATLDDALNAPKLFATRQYDTEGWATLFGLVQCTPDLSRDNCSLCVQQAISEMQEYSTISGMKMGGRVLFPSCNIRYEAYPFYNVTPAFLSPTSTGEGGKGRKTTWIAIGTTISAIIVVLLFGSFLWYKRRRNKRGREEHADNQEVQLLGMGEGRIGRVYSYDFLREEQQLESQEFPLFPLGLTLEATQNFSDENKLGEGGFGPVYKGILANGKEIAVKRLSRTSGQGLQEFKNEVTVIAKLQHKNLVSLLGCCLEGNELLLIYEYMPNKSLDFLLFDSTRRVQLNWKTRMFIINGIARGLLYLHEDSRLRIIHRDLKASNVLLDHEMNPKISDFGMARIFGGNQSEANTKRVVGTYGYMAPEYAMEGLFSVKSDVFSFGVLLLEIVTGKRNSGFYLSDYGESLLTHAWKLWSKGHALELMDQTLVELCVSTEVLKCIHIGLLCVQQDPADRPTMSYVVVMLASDTITLPKPTKPAFSVGRVVGKSSQSSDNKICSVNEVTLSSVSPRS